MSHTSLDYSVTWKIYWFHYLILSIYVQCLRKWNQVLLNFGNILKSNNYHYPRSFTFSSKTYQKSFKNEPTSHSAIAIIFLDYFFLPIAEDKSYLFFITISSTDLRCGSQISSNYNVPCMQIYLTHCVLRVAEYTSRRERKHKFVLTWYITTKIAFCKQSIH